MSIAQDTPLHFDCCISSYLIIRLDVWDYGSQLGLGVVSPDVSQDSSHIGLVEGSDEGRHGYTSMLGEVKEEGGEGNSGEGRGRGEQW